MRIDGLSNIIHNPLGDNNLQFGRIFNNCGLSCVGQLYQDLSSPNTMSDTQIQQAISQAVGMANAFISLIPGSIPASVKSEIATLQNWTPSQGIQGIAVASHNLSNDMCNLANANAGNSVSSSCLNAFLNIIKSSAQGTNRDEFIGVMVMCNALAEVVQNTQFSNDVAALQSDVLSGNSSSINADIVNISNDIVSIENI